MLIRLDMRKYFSLYLFRILGMCVYIRICILGEPTKLQLQKGRWGNNKRALFSWFAAWCILICVSVLIWAFRKYMVVGQKRNICCSLKWVWGKTFCLKFPGLKIWLCKKKGQTLTMGACEGKQWIAGAVFFRENSIWETHNERTPERGNIEMIYRKWAAEVKIKHWGACPRESLNVEMRPTADHINSKGFNDPKYKNSPPITHNKERFQKRALHYVFPKAPVIQFQNPIMINDYTC